MPLHKYDYLFAIGTIFAFLDAWNIGANDVANSWATSVSSRSLTYIQAMCAGGLMEFAGAVGVGGRVADTIRTGIVPVERFDGAPNVLMLGMVCAVIGSSVFLTICTKFGLPVSTTHSILGAVLGMGVGALGSDGVKWVGYNDDGSVNIDDGVVQVFMAWIIAPFLSGAFGAIIFLMTKYGVLLRSNPAMKALISIPFYFWLTGSLITMLLIYKGGDYEVNLDQETEVPGVIVAAGAAWAMLIAIFLVPWVYRVVIREDWQLRWFHIPMGPLLLRRGEVPPPPADFTGAVRNFYEGHLTRDELDARRAAHTGATVTDVEAQHPHEKVAGSDSSAVEPVAATVDNSFSPVPRKSLIGPKPDAPFYSPSFIFWGLKWAFLRGVDIDIIAMQNEKSLLAPDIAEIHARGAHFDNKAEFLFSFLQIMTAASASFVHGANDIANAVGPYATIFQIWDTGVNPGEEATVPVWILAFGGIGIIVGLWTYGYNIMSNLGNRMTLMSPARGFAMELGATITVVIATQLGMFPHSEPRLEANVFQLCLSPPLSASLVPSLVSVSATVTGAASTGAWSHGSTLDGSSPSPALVSSAAASLYVLPLSPIQQQKANIRLGLHSLCSQLDPADGGLNSVTSVSTSINVDHAVSALVCFNNL